MNVLGICCLTATIHSFGGRGRETVLFSGGARPPHSQLLCFRLDSIPTWVDHVTCQSLSQHLLLLALMIDLGMAIYDPVRIRDNRDSF